jgi:multidrug efflux pump subunit AcrB
MVWIVRVALQRSYTFIVFALFTLIFGPPGGPAHADGHLPNIRIPVIAVVWTYTGLPPDDMSGRVIYFSFRGLRAVGTGTC